MRVVEDRGGASEEVNCQQQGKGNAVFAFGRDQAGDTPLLESSLSSEERKSGGRDGKEVRGKLRGPSKSGKLCNDRGGRNVLGVAKLLRASNYAHDVSLAMHENQRCFGTLRLVDLAKACGATYRAKACGVLKATYSTVSAGGAMWSYDKQQKQHPQLT
uniref:Uncharacterized protein n=1 Tax=Parascaris univalens TaxID=6257 RepID=A0A915AUU6_PARUN